MIQARRLRLDAVHTGLPAVMWVIIVLGALISLSASFFFKVEDVRLHGIQVLLLAVFIGLVIFMIFALDRPFQRVGVNAGASIHHTAARCSTRTLGRRESHETHLDDHRRKRCAE
jgi:hypothetical protein